MFCGINYGSVIVYGYILGIFILSYMFLTQVWAVSGEQRGSSGRKRGSIPLKWATLAVTPQTLPMRRCAQVCLWPTFHHPIFKLSVTYCLWRSSHIKNVYTIWVSRIIHELFWCWLSWNDCKMSITPTMVLEVLYHFFLKKLAALNKRSSASTRSHIIDSTGQTQSWSKWLVLQSDQ